MNQWIEDTDHVILTQKRQIDVLTKTIQVQASLIDDVKKQSAALEAKLPELWAALEKVQHSLEAVPELQEKVATLITDLAKAVTDGEDGRNELHVRVDELITELGEMKNGEFPLACGHLDHAQPIAAVSLACLVGSLSRAPPQVHS